MGSPRSMCYLFSFVLGMCMSVHLICLQAQPLHTTITIVEHPSSLLVPVNAMAVFSCTARCTPSPCELAGQWIVNHMFMPSQYKYNELTMTLMLNTSEVHNSSEVRCYFDINIIPASVEHMDSYTATLIIMDNQPLSPNPLLEINASHINLSWSPPFLWPGHAIQYFNVSITNKSDGSVTYHETNNNFGDRVVSFTKDIQEESLMCTEMTINISAISNYSYSTLQQPLQMFNVTHRVLPSPFHVNNLSEVTTTNVHPCCDENNHVDLELIIQLQLPRLLCNNQKVNSTFILRNDSNDFVTQVGPILHLGSSVITENLTYIVKANQTYSLTVRVGYDSHTITNTTYQLDTFVDQSECEQYSTTTKNVKPDIEIHDDGLLDYLLMGGSLTLVLGTIVTITTGMYISYYRKRRKERIFEGLSARIQGSLVNNPTYDSMPIYEQILPHIPPQTTITTCIDESERSTQQDPSIHQENHLCRSDNHNSDKPMCVQNALQLVDTTETLEHNDSIGQNVNDTCFTDNSERSCVHSDFHPTLNLDDVSDHGINISGVTDDGEATQAVSVSMALEQETKVFDIYSDCDIELTPPGLLNNQ